MATGDQTLKISMPGTETVTTDQVEALLDSLNEITSGQLIWTPGVPQQTSGYDGSFEMAQVQQTASDALENTDPDPADRRSVPVTQA